MSVQSDYATRYPLRQALKKLSLSERAAHAWVPKDFKPEEFHDLWDAQVKKDHELWDSGQPSALRDALEAILIANNEKLAARLVGVPHRHLNWKLVRAIWESGKTNAHRGALASAWEEVRGDCFYVLGENTVDAFRDAKFPTDHLPEQMTIWRGVAWAEDDLDGPVGGDEGLSWTRNRDVACWFAFRATDKERNAPYVMRRVVDRSEVLAHFKGSEDEIIVAPDAFENKVWGNLRIWRAGRDRYAKAKK